MSTLRSRFVAVTATAMAASLVLAGCAASDEDTTTAGSTTTTDSGDSVAAGCEAYAAYAGNEGADTFFPDFNVGDWDIASKTELRREQPACILVEYLRRRT